MMTTTTYDDNASDRRHPQRGHARPSRVRWHATRHSWHLTKPTKTFLMHFLKFCLRVFILRKKKNWDFFCMVITILILSNNVRPYLLIILDARLVALVTVACTFTDKPLLTCQDRTAVRFNCKTIHQLHDETNCIIFLWTFTARCHELDLQTLTLVNTSYSCYWKLELGKYILLMIYYWCVIEPDVTQTAIIIIILITILIISRWS